MNVPGMAKSSRARRTRTLAWLSLWLICGCLVAPAIAGAQQTSGDAPAAIKTDDSGKTLEQFRGKKLLALYLTAFILLLLAVLVLIATMRIRYQVDRRPEATEEMEDLWFKKKEEDETSD